MNMNSIINMVIRRVMNIVISKGINAGVDQMSKRKGGTKNQQGQDVDSAQTKQRLRQTAKMTRRMTKL